LLNIAKIEDMSIITLRQLYRSLSKSVELWTQRPKHTQFSHSRANLSFDQNLGDNDDLDTVAGDIENLHQVQPDEKINTATKAHVLLDDNLNVDILVLQNLAEELGKASRSFVNDQTMTDDQRKKFLEGIQDHNAPWSNRKGTLKVTLKDFGDYKIVKLQNTYTNTGMDSKAVAVSFCLEPVDNKDSTAPSSIYVNYLYPDMKPSFISVKTNQDQEFLSYTYKSGIITFKTKKLAEDERALIDSTTGDLLIDRSFMPRKKIAKIPVVQDYHRV
jgi:hypothetical protein